MARCYSLAPSGQPIENRRETSRGVDMFKQSGVGFWGWSAMAVSEDGHILMSIGEAIKWPRDVEEGGHKMTR